MPVSKVPDVLLIVPPVDTISQFEDLGENLGSAYIAAVLRRRGYSVTIIDAQAESLSLRDTIRQSKETIAWSGTSGVSRNQRKSPSSPSILGLSVLFSSMIKPAISIIKVLKPILDKESLVTMGGHVPTFASKYLFRDCPELNFIVSGEGEYTLLNVIDKLHNGNDWSDTPGIILPGAEDPFTSRPLITPLDDLPFPSRDTLPAYRRRGAIARILGSRGCYGNCSFCSINAFYRTSPGPKWRGRSPENIAEEMERLAKDYGVTEVMFSDDNFIGPGLMGKERAVKFSQEIIRRGIQVQFKIACRANDVDNETLSPLKEAGLKGVFLGVESGVQRALDSFNKGVTVEQNRQAALLIQDLGLELILGFIMFDPDTTLDEILENLAFLRSIGIGATTAFNRIGALNKLDAYEGTPIAKKLREAGRLKGDYTGYSYRIADPRAEFIHKTGLLASKVQRVFTSILS